MTQDTIRVYLISADTITYLLEVFIKKIKVLVHREPYTFEAEARLNGT
jgi:hypothetical protein